MITLHYDERRLVNILLNHQYPDGNCALLLERAQLVRVYDNDPALREPIGYQVVVNLPSAHWAFTACTPPTGAALEEYREVVRQRKGGVPFDEIQCSDGSIVKTKDIPVHRDEECGACWTFRHTGLGKECGECAAR